MYPKQLESVGLAVLAAQHVPEPPAARHATVVRVGAIADVESEDELRARYERWSRLAREEGQQVPDLSPAEIAAEVAARRVYVDVNIAEFVDFSDGRRVVGDVELGYTSRANSVTFGEDLVARPDPWSLTDADDIVETVGHVVSSDGEDGPERWGRLRDACAQRGIDVTLDQLAAAPFEVELTERLRRRLESAAS